MIDHKELSHHRKKPFHLLQIIPLSGTEDFPITGKHLFNSGVFMPLFCCIVVELDQHFQAFYIDGGYLIFSMKGKIRKGKLMKCPVISSARDTKMKITNSTRITTSENNCTA